MFRFAERFAQFISCVWLRVNLVSAQGFSLASEPYVSDRFVPKAFWWTVMVCLSARQSWATHSP